MFKRLKVQSLTFFFSEHAGVFVCVNTDMTLCSSCAAALILGLKASAPEDYPNQ